MQISRRELLSLFGLGLVGCDSNSPTGRGAAAGTRPLTSETPDARRQTLEETLNATGGESTADASSTTGEPLTTTTAPRTVIQVVGRDGWGAAEAGPGMVEHSIERLTLHHTGVELEDNREAPSRLRAHQEFHQRDRGWPDLAYHFAIDREGNIYEGRATGFRGDTATSYDPTGHLLVALEGNFDIELPAQLQMSAVIDLLAWGAQKYRLDPASTKGHRDYAQTHCPGRAVYMAITSGDIAAAVTARMEDPIDLLLLVGEDAVDRVRSIGQGGNTAVWKVNRA